MSILCRGGTGGGGIHFQYFFNIALPVRCEKWNCGETFWKLICHIFIVNSYTKIEISRTEIILSITYNLVTKFVLNDIHGRKWHPRKSFSPP